MKKLNCKGSALLQVLVLSAVIATIVVVLLKFSITRTSNAIQTKHVVGAKSAMQACMSLLNEEELNRMTQGRAPYFEENSEFPCSYSGYSAVITRSNSFSHGDGIVRPLEFKITFYNPNDLEEPADPVEEETTP